MRVPTELGRCVTTWRGVTGFPEGLCSREGKVVNGFVLVITLPDGTRCTLGVRPRTMSW